MLLKRFVAAVSVSAAAAAMLLSPASSFAGKPTTASTCKSCHTPEEKVVRGNLFGVSEGFKTVQVSVGSLIWVIKYGDDLKLQGAEKISGIPKDKEVAVTFTGDEKTPYATVLSVKQPAKIAPEKLVSVEDMAKLVDQGPDKGKYVLIDSRPPARYNEAHLPGAVAMPNEKFDALKDKVLPKEKDKLVIFYCAGPT